MTKGAKEMAIREVSLGELKQIRDNLNDDQLLTVDLTDEISELHEPEGYSFTPDPSELLRDIDPNATYNGEPLEGGYGVSMIR